MSAVVVALVLIGGVGYGLATALGGGRTASALEVSGQQFNSVVGGITSASDISAVASVAERARPAAERIAREWRALEPDEDAAVVVEQLKAEERLLTSLTPLSGLAAEPLAVWGSEHRSITEALEQEQETRAALRAVRPDAARALPDTRAMMVAVTGAVGSELGEDAASRARELLDDLSSAITTADIRAVGAQAAAEKTAVSAVLPGLDADSGRRALAAYSRVLTAFEQLGSIDAERTETWASTRADLTATLGELGGSSAAAAGLPAHAANALDAADRVVNAAAAAFADWKAAHGAAVEKRNADAEALSAYTADVRSAMKQYEVLRNDLSSWLERVERADVSVTYFEAWATLEDAVEARRSVRSVLTSLRVPDGVQAEHDALVDIVGRAAAAVQSAYDSVDQHYECTENCYFRDMPAFKRFSAESSQISKEFGPALSSWESAAAGAKAAVEGRALPVKPEV